MDFEERILLHAFQLNETDDILVDFIRKHKKDIPKMTVGKVTEELYMVPNTVMRFCRKLDYSGFSEMKVKLKEETENEEASRIVLEDLPFSIVKTRKLINMDRMLKAADMMKNAKTVHFLGVGESRQECEYMVKHLMRVDKPSLSYRDYHELEFRVGRCDSSELLVFISVSGETERLVKVAKRAKERGIPVISITGFTKNSLSQMADVALYFYCEEHRINGFNVTDRLGLGLLLKQLSEVFWRIIYL